MINKLITFHFFLYKSNVCISNLNKFAQRSRDRKKLDCKDIHLKKKILQRQAC